LDEALAYKLYFPLSLKIMLSIMAVAFTSVGIIIVVGPALFQNGAGPPWFFSLIFLVFIVGCAIRILSIPHRIMLHRDETVEFISVLRRRRVPARAIVSIKPEGTTYGFLVVRADNTKIRLLAQFNGFHDFLNRLKAMNPAVKLRGC
jgi:hypothetical protein